MIRALKKSKREIETDTIIFTLSATLDQMRKNVNVFSRHGLARAFNKNANILLETETAKL